MSEPISPSAESEQLRTWHRELLEAGLAWELPLAHELRRGMAFPFTSSPNLAERVRNTLSLRRSRKGFPR